jgi:hypothetical protein
MPFSPDQNGSQEARGSLVGLRLSISNVETQRQWRCVFASAEAALLVVSKEAPPGLAAEVAQADQPSE